jgi:NADH-quinone oxidoreductase subunit A
VRERPSFARPIRVKDLYPHNPVELRSIDSQCVGLHVCELLEVNGALRYHGVLRRLPRRTLPMPQNYVPIFIFIAIVGSLLPITLLLAKLVRPSNPSKTKLMPYECGIDPIDSARGRYTVRYYIIAILFVVFDVETIFLFPWAVKFKAFGLFGLLEMLIFLAILIVGYIWVWRKGALEWV